MSKIDKLLKPVIEEAKLRWPGKDMWYETPCTCGGALHAGSDQHWEHCDRPKAQRDWKFHLSSIIEQLSKEKEDETL